MPDCGAVTRAKAVGGNRLPTNSACCGLRARMTPSRSATVSTLPARNGDPVCLSCDKCSDRCLRSSPATKTPLSIRIHRCERQGEWQEAGADTGRSGEPTRGEALGGDRIADPLWLVAGRLTADARSPRCRISCRPHQVARRTLYIGRLCWVARSRSLHVTATWRTSSNCATALSNVRAPSAMLSMSPFSSCAC